MHIPFTVVWGKYDITIFIKGFSANFPAYVNIPEPLLLVSTGDCPS